MRNLMKRVRIVHSPEERSYYVDSKSVFGLRWRKLYEFDYVDIRDSSPYGCHDLADDAYAKAKKKAEMLLARTVVWEQVNYLWGP